MKFEAIAFWTMASMAVIPALAIVISRNIVHMAFWLLGTLLGVAGLYLVMGADFLGMTQVFVYIGGINVLLLFGIMLTNRDPVFVRKMAKRPRMVPALLLGFLVLLGMTKAMSSTEWKVEKDAGIPGVVAEAEPGAEAESEEESLEAEPTGRDGTAKKLGTYLLSDYILPFEIVSVLLLVVLVGAARIARREPEGEES